MPQLPREQLNTWDIFYAGTVWDLFICFSSLDFIQSRHPACNGSRSPRWAPRSIRTLSDERTKFPCTVISLQPNLRRKTSARNSVSEVQKIAILKANIKQPRKPTTGWQTRNCRSETIIQANRVKHINSFCELKSVTWAMMTLQFSRCSSSINLRSQMFTKIDQRNPREVTLCC